jgi:hypothetical protein
VKFLKFIGSIGIGLLVLRLFVYPEYVHRYRLTMDVDTPDGVKTGSTVIQVERDDNRWDWFILGKISFSFYGEALFLDLGRGKNVIALLAKDPRTAESSSMIWLHIQTFLSFNQRFDEDVWSGKLSSAVGASYR